MTTFNTGNPIGSTDARDRLDNSENADILENSTSLRYHADRLGTVRKTRYGMQKEHDSQIAAHEAEHDSQIAAHEAEHDSQIAAHENEFDAHISGMAISNVGTFSAGYTLTNIRQSLRYTVDGYEYSWSGTFPKVVAAGSTPATSGGIGINAWVVASIGASIATPAQTNSRLSSNQVVSPAGLNAVVPYAPTVNPTLDLDFAKQKYRWYAGAAGLTESSTPSLMTFTRSSIATFFDAMGVMRQAANDIPRIDYDPVTGECRGLLVEEQRTNLFPYSAYPASASADQWWNRLQCDVYPNVAVAPDGTMTAAKAVVSVGAATTGNDGVGFFAAPVVTSSATHTLTLYVKDAGAGYIRIRESINTGQIAKINLTTGAITAEAGYTSTTFTVATTDVGNGWWRVVVVRTPTTTFGFNLKPGIDVGDSVSGIYVWGAQLEVGAFPTSYIPTPAVFSDRASSATYLDANGVVHTAASGVARSNAYVYDSYGVLRPIGLLLESSATNQLLYSEQFDNAAWGKSLYGVASAPVVTANYGIAPDGQTTADRVVFALNGGTTIDDKSELQQLQTTVAGTTYTQSVWLKTADVSTKVVQLSFSGENPKLITVTGTWQRFSNTGTASDTARGFRLALRGTTGTSDSADLLVWGAQQGVGNYPTSYIPTTSAQVTRAADTSTSAQVTRTADNAVISGANFSQWYKQYEGTLISDGRIGDEGNFYDSAGAGRGMASISDGTMLNRIRLGAAILANTLVNNGVTQASVTVGSSTFGRHKIAMAFKLNSFNAVADGVAGVEDTALTVPYLTQLNIGKSYEGIGYYSGHIRSLKYFPKALTSAELQAMTA